MSHAMAEVTLADGNVLYGEYNGTCDLARPSMFATTAEVHAQWRSVDASGCGCTSGRERARYRTTYGDGTDAWDVAVCRRCMVVVGPLANPHLYGVTDDWPELYGIEPNG